MKLKINKIIADSPQIVKFLGGERWKPNLGVIQVVLGRAPVGEDGNIPKFPAAYMEVDLGIVPGAQQSTDISNWLQDEIIAVLNRPHAEANINAKVVGVSYRRKLFRGKYVYMVHAKNAVLQELVASTLRDYKIPVVPWVIYNAAKEVGDMESGLKAFKAAMAAITGAVLSSGDRRSPGRRYWNAHKDILKSIAGDETMAAHTAPRTGRQPRWSRRKNGRGITRRQKNKCVLEQAALAKAPRVVVGYVGNKKHRLGRAMRKCSRETL
jgi:hypothetical protein